MKPVKRTDFRIVVQYVHEDSDFPWHLIVYGGGGALRPRRFRSVGDVLLVICFAVPEFDRRDLVTRSDSHQSYIAYTGDLVLSDSQLSAMGVKE